MPLVRKIYPTNAISESECLAWSSVSVGSIFCVRQDPYCSLKLEKETRRTKAVKKGGQHPEWDEEIRFALLEDTEDVLARTTKNNGDEDTPPPVPAKTSPTGKFKFNKNRILRLSCYADDPREPELIGEVTVNLSEVLTKGETDGQLRINVSYQRCSF